jgi:D-alanyl-D-alanine carboxypeptidase
MKTRTLVSYSIPVALIVVALIIVVRNDAIFLTQKTQTEVIVSEPQKDTVFKDLKLEAKSVYVYDVKNNKAIFDIEPETQLPLASITKLMVALAASEIIPEYLLIPIKGEDLLPEGDTGLKPGELWKRNRLIDMALVTSSNDAIHAIASVAGSLMTTNAPDEDTERKAFVKYMNEIAQRLGLTQTYFLNGSGLDVSTGVSGSYGSAKDVAQLTAHILKEKPELLEATQYGSIAISSENSIHLLSNTNKALPSIPHVLASKTGYTDLSGGNLVVAWNAGLDRPIIITVLGSSYDGRFEDMKNLVGATLEYLK